MWKVFRYNLLLPLILASNLLSAQDAHDYLRQGDKAYLNGDFASAESNYRKALDKEQAPSGAYNLGNSTYRQGRYAEAARQFEAAAEQATDPIAKARAYHNLGNAHYRQGNFAASAEAYKNSLRWRPQDPETSRNLVNALRQLPPPEQKKPNDPSDSPQDKPEQPPSPSPADSAAPPPPQDPADADQPPHPSDDPSDDESEPSAKKSGDQPQLLPDEARQLLDIMNQEEKKVQQKFHKANARGTKSAKDW